MYILRYRNFSDEEDYILPVSATVGGGSLYLIGHGQSKRAHREYDNEMADIYSDYHRYSNMTKKIADRRRDINQSVKDLLDDTNNKFKDLGDYIDSKTGKTTRRYDTYLRNKDKINDNYNRKSREISEYLESNLDHLYDTKRARERRAGEILDKKIESAARKKNVGAIIGTAGLLGTSLVAAHHAGKNRRDFNPSYFF